MKLREVNFLEITEMACLSGWEFEADNSPHAKFFFPRQFRTPSTNSFAYSQSELHDMNMNDLRLRNKSTHARGLVILL